jgi:hypothetical protein
MPYSTVGWYLILRLYAPPFLVRLIVELHDKVPGAYHALGVSTSSRFGLIEAVLYSSFGQQYERLLANHELQAKGEAERKFM